MLKIALCDDEPGQRSLTGGLLREYMEQRPSLAARLTVVSSGEELLEQAEAEGGFDLYVLDVIMPELSGIDVGVKLRELGSDAPIIYLTTSPDYAVASYNAQAAGYLLKPVEREALFPLLDRVLKELAQEESRILTVKRRERVSLLRYAGIRYAEGANHSVIFYLAGGQTVTAGRRGSLEEAVAPLLADERFLQVGTSYLVNMLYVDSLEQDCFHMREGGRVPIPRLKRSMVRQCFLDFVLKRGMA